MSLGVYQALNGFDHLLVDRSRVCAVGVLNDCYRQQLGVVDANPYEERMRISFGKPQRTEDIVSGRGELDGWPERPPVGTRVTVEWWDGEIVAVYDRARDVRYKTLDWENKTEMHITGIVAAVLGAALMGLAAAAGVNSLREIIRVRRARAAGTTSV